jgi:hypothetical protein
MLFVYNLHVVLPNVANTNSARERVFILIMTRINLYSIMFIYFYIYVKINLC